MDEYPPVVVIGAAAMDTKGRAHSALIPATSCAGDIRISVGGVREVILATNPSMEGDATALYLRQQLIPYNLRITRLARGLPVGGDLEYADQNTLLRALAGRHEMN